jgi:hypothetical protein
MREALELVEPISTPAVVGVARVQQESLHPQTRWLARVALASLRL